MEQNSIAATQKILIFLTVIVNQSMQSIMYVIGPFMVAEFYPQASDGEVSYYATMVETSFRISIFIFSFVWQAINSGFVSDRIGRIATIMICLSINALCLVFIGLSQSLYMLIIVRFINGIGGGVLPVIKAYMLEISNDQNFSTIYSYAGLGMAISELISPALAGWLSHPAQRFPAISCQFFIDFPYILPTSIMQGTIRALVAVIATILWFFKGIKTRQEHDIPQGAYRMLRSRDYIIGVLLYGISGAVQIGFSTMVPLFARNSKEKGGLAWPDESKVGLAFTISGACNIVQQVIDIQKVINPYLKKSMGLANAVVCISSILLPVLVITPFISYVDYTTSIILTTISIVFNRNILGSNSILLSMIISNSIPVEIQGHALGISQSVVGLFRGIGTITMGGIYSSSLSWNLWYPFNFHFAFLLSALFILAIVLTSRFGFSKNVDKRIQTSLTENLLPSDNNHKNT